MRECPSSPNLTSAEEVSQWSAAALQRLDQEVDPQVAQAILLDCGCQYPAQALEPIAADYQVHGDIDRLLILLQELYKRFLKDDLKLSDDQVAMVVELELGLAGKRTGNTVITTKIPKSEYLADYLKEANPSIRRRMYCHCPRMRDAIEEGVEISLTYCYCEGGFYKGLWENTGTRCTG
jgi:hypothetical protein